MICLKTVGRMPGWPWSAIPAASIVFHAKALYSFVENKTVLDDRI